MAHGAAERPVKANISVEAEGIACALIPASELASPARRRYWDLAGRSTLDGPVICFPDPARLFLEKNVVLWGRTRCS